MRRRALIVGTAATAVLAGALAYQRYGLALQARFASDPPRAPAGQRPFDEKVQGECRQNRFRSQFGSDSIIGRSISAGGQLDLYSRNPHEKRVPEA